MQCNTREFLMLLVLLISATLLNGQEPFSKVFNFNLHQCNARTLVEAGGNYFMAGNCLQKGLSQREDKPLLFKIDGHGNQEWFYVYEDDNPFFASNPSQDLLHLNGGIYFFYNELSFQAAWRELNYSPVLRYDIASEEQLIHYIVRDTATNNHPPSAGGMLETSDGTILLLMTQNLGTDVAHVLVQEIDANEPNKLINDFRFQEPDSIYQLSANDIVEIDDGYLISGETAPIDGTRLRFLFLLKIDKDLNFIDFRIHDEIQYDGRTLNVAVDKNEDFVIPTSQRIIDPTVPILFGIFKRPIITKFDRDLDIIWQRPLVQWTFEETTMNFEDIILSHDEDGYIMVGELPYLDTLDQGGGTIAKLDLDGDSIFYRVIQPMERAVSVEFRDVIQTSDDHYMTVATMTPWTFVDSLYHKSWLLKFDEEGHVVNVDRSSVSDERVFPEVSIFPNPVSDYLYIEQDKVSGLSYRLYSAEGELMATQLGTEAYHTYILDVSGWPSGSYYLEITDNAGYRYTQNIIISR